MTPAFPIPADAVTASGSGLDPHISVPNALLQARRVAEARGLSEEVREMVAAHTEGRDPGDPGRAAGQCPDAEPGFGREAMTANSERPGRCLPADDPPLPAGRLKVYLGYAAGVGKTWQMLQEGHRLKEDGIDVVDRPCGDARPGGDGEARRRAGGRPPAQPDLPGDRHGGDGRARRSFAASPRSPSWTNWPTPTSRGAGTPSGTRTSRTCWRPGSTSSRR